MKTNRFQRFVAFLLVLCMVIPMLPEFTLPAVAAGTSTTATEDPVIVIAGSDFQNKSGDAAGATAVTNLLNSIKTNGGYDTVDGFLFAGDYSNSWYEANTTSGVTALKGAVNSVYPGLADGDSAVYVQGNHDPTECITNGVLSDSGAHDTDDYGVFVINEDDFQWQSDSTVETVTATANRLRGYLMAKVRLGYTKPIFVVSHVPLHYTMRTAKNGDSRYGDILYAVLDEAADAGLNIIFMYGHNHSASWEDSHGGAAVFYEKGDMLNVPLSSQTEYEARELKFTYMNAGYVGYYSEGTGNTGVDTTLTMSVFEITADTVKISRYSADGAYSNLKSTGVTNNAYTEPFAVNTKTVASPYTLTLNKTIDKTVGEVAVTVTVDGVVKLAKAIVGVSDIPKGYSAYETFDITVEEYTEGDTAVVTLPVSSGFSKSCPVIIIDHENNKSFPATSFDGTYVTFETNHFSLYTVAQADVASTTAGGTVGKYVRRINAYTEMLVDVPYIITVNDIGDSDGEYMLTGTSATKDGGVVGLTLRQNYSVTTSQLWYYDGPTTRALLYKNDTTQYLLIGYTGEYSSSPVGNVRLGAVDSTTEGQRSRIGGNGKGDFWIYPYDNTNTLYLNQHGGPSSTVASAWTTATYFNVYEVVSAAYLTVTPSQNAVTTDSTILLTPTVTAGTKEISDYSLTWESEDTSIATVDENGVVTPKKPGQVYIKTTLNSVEGNEITSPTFVETLITVVDIDLINVDKGYNSVNSRPDSITATTNFGQKLEKVTSVTAGTASGPFVITERNTGWVLTGNKDADSGKAVGLEMLSHLDLYTDAPLWYYDGTYLLYGSSTGSDNYLVYADSKVTLGTLEGTVPFNTVEQYGSGTSYNIYNTEISDGAYLNQVGGTGYNAAGVYGYAYWSRWYFNIVLPAREVSLTVAPSSYLLSPGDSEELTATVKVDGIETSTYAIKWYSSDNSVVTVSSTGEVTGITSGNAVITATLTSADGQALDAYLSVDIAIEVAPLTSDASGTTVTYSTDHKLELVTDLAAGTASGPFIITNYVSGDLLTGNFITKDHPDFAGNGGQEGLQIIPYYDYNELWYYDGQYLRYGSDINSTADDNYVILKYVNSNFCITLGTKDEADQAYHVINSVRRVKEDTYALGYLGQDGTETTTASRYLNQLGGEPKNVVGFYSLGSFSVTDGVETWASLNNGSRWQFWRIVEQEIALTVSPTPSVMRPKDVQQLTTSLTVDGVEVTDYKVKWSIADSNVATIYQGKLTGVAGGTTTVTATLTKINGETLADAITLNIPVTVKSVSSATLSTETGEVAQRASSNATVVVDLDEVARTSVYLNVTYTDGTTQQVPVTVSMLSDANGKRVNTIDVTDESGVQTLSNLTITFGDYTYEGFTLKVVAPVGDDYPDYPNEGSVYVDKTGTGINFTSTGVAQIELSTTGVPVRTGADVIIMLDTSSSMDMTVSGNTKNRREVLVDSLNQLIGTLQQKDINGQELDIKVAVADFNNYFVDEDSPYYINPNDTVSGGATWGSRSGAPAVFTGSHALDADAFVDVHDVEAFTAAQLDGKSGTNYDYAFDAVYQLGTAITEANSTGEERDLFVIFMSDGCPFQFNFHSASSNAVYWNNWVTGTMTDGSNDTVDMFGTNSNRSYYNAEGKHWTAEAIKGDPRVDYSIIRKNDYRDTDGDNWIQVPGLGATMYSIGFCLAVDGEVTVDTMDTVLQRIASSDEFYFKADTAAELDDAFGAIAGEIMYSASNAYFMDTMGEDFDIQLKPFSYDVLNADGEKTGETVTNNPFIEVRSYSIFTPQDHLDGNCTLAQIGDRKTNTDGSYIYTVLETVTFNEDGTAAYSNVLFADSDGDGENDNNILIDGVIYANTFWYNTSKTDTVRVIYNGITIDVAPETFCWKVGTISTSELALNYFVYLTGSMEGDREAGVYDTNAHAELFYTNYLGHRCSQEVATPKMPWEQASVGYAFYLVDSNGNPIIDQATGKTGSFRYAVELTQPIYSYFLLNDGTSLFSSDLLQASNVLPEGYALYDAGAGYKVSLNSNGIGAYTITSSMTVQTTYVDGIEANSVTRPSTGGTSVSVETHNYVTANTVVWFAVVATTEAVPDTVVIDYGLPVDIHPLLNDLMMTTGNATLAGIGTTSISGYQSTLASGFVSAENALLTVPYGQAMITDNGEDDVNNAVIRYIPGTMQMDREAVFTYAVYYTGSVGSQGYYYSSVTVIPATTIYYEDNFQEGNSAGIVYGVYDANDQKITAADQQWTDTSTAVDGVQDEDRPGDDNFTFSSIDANNIYGYDSNYTGFTTYSMGSAKKVTVNASKYATATFTFKGTGFDVISMTGGETGTIAIKVQGTTGDPEYYIVDTYYGYKLVDGEWVVDTEDNDTLYQVPVMKVDCESYDTYTVTITASYVTFFDHRKDGSYDFYLDAIRIYDPANDGTGNTVVQGAYKDDAEGWPSYQELRNKIISTDHTLNTPTTNGILFIDGKADQSGNTYWVSNYTNFGPNNELYLAPNQAITFNLAKDLTTQELANIASIQIGVKTLGDFSEDATTNLNVDDNGGTASISIKNVSGSKSAKVTSVGTATDMYYDITNLMGEQVIIQNTGSAGILSITNVKITYKADPYGTSQSDLFSVTPSTGSMALAALYAEDEAEQNPTTGDMGMEMLLIMTACILMLAVLVMPKLRKRNAR